MKNGSMADWFRGIKGKLLLAAFIPVIGFGILFAVSFSGTTKISSFLENAQMDVIPTIQANGGMRVGRNQFAFQALMAIDNADKNEAFDKYVNSATKAIDEFEKDYKNYSGTSAGPEEQALRDAAKDKIPLLIKTAHEVLTLIKTKDPTKLAEANTLIQQQYSTLNEGVRDFNIGVDKIYDEQTAADAKSAKEESASIFKILTMVTAVSALAIFATLLWIGAQISNSVNSIAQRLSEANANVSNSVEQLNEAGNSLSQSSTEAAASLEETVAALEELTSMVQMNSDNAKQAAALSASSRDAAEQGEKEIQNLITSMTYISNSSKKIEEIIHVIDDIAFQTNLLALNAAVEAARAGEQGKGFAVVAEAVRTLAQRSAASAKDISTLIKESVSQIESGSDVADKSGIVLTNIVTSIKKVSDLNNEIAAASAEQSTGIQQIGKAMNQLDQSSQSNAASAEEIAATSGEINNLASTAQALTVELNEVVLGASAEGGLHNSSETKRKPHAKAPHKSNVIAMKGLSRPKAKGPSTSVIPFDDDVRGKVGGTDGF